MYDDAKTIALGLFVIAVREARKWEALASRKSGLDAMFATWRASYWWRAAFAFAETRFS